jgi:hypothetical protein
MRFAVRLAACLVTCCALAAPLSGCGRNEQGSELQGPQTPGVTQGTNPAVSSQTNPTTSTPAP